MPTISKGKLDTTVTISSSVLIWEAESSSTVAVCPRKKKKKKGMLRMLRFKMNTVAVFLLR